MRCSSFAARILLVSLSVPSCTFPSVELASPGTDGGGNQATDGATDPSSCILCEEAAPACANEAAINRDACNNACTPGPCTSACQATYTTAHAACVTTCETCVTNACGNQVVSCADLAGQ